jgi:uncharacterized membrane protein YphA (DoxX/SURF4 family)
MRVAAGAAFLYAGLRKWQWVGYENFPNLLRDLATLQVGTPLFRYAHAVAGFVQAHGPACTLALFLGELILGLLLCIGALTRLAALGALAVSVNALLLFWPQGAQVRQLHGASIVIEIALLLSGAGRAYGIDSRFARRRPGWILW